MLNADGVSFEVCDNYQKQTFRNRTEIYAANGKLVLTVPVRFTQTNRQQYKDVRIANDDPWQQNHLKSLQSAYSMSPFYEFYIDDLMPLFEKHYNYILDFNLNCFEVLNNCMQLDLKSKLTASFEKSPQHTLDSRFMVNRNYKCHALEYYTQVFTEKHGFIANLSILDLLFNEGPNSELYLKRQTL